MIRLMLVCKTHPPVLQKAIERRHQLAPGQVTAHAGIRKKWPVPP